jgi:peptidyl-prolyl cis-trans isomerase B (cyclophilin B)
LRGLTVIAALACALPFAACGEEDERSSIDPDAPAQTAPPEPAGPPKGCEEAEEPQPKTGAKEKKPSGELDSSKTYTVTVKTNCGSFSWDLDLDKAPKTSASIVALAEKDFYDDTKFHRIVPDFVIQGGDPEGTGGGGPGYKTRDKPPKGTKYTKGLVAMAKAGNEPAGTAGSQFFVVTGKGGGNLTPDYAVVGKVSKGLKVVERIGELGGQNEQPTFTVVIEDLSVKES